MKNNIITIILIVVIGMVAFWYLTKTDTSTSYLATDVKTTDSVDAKYIYNILQQMAQVNLDDSIFEDLTFQNLKDNTVSFSPQEAGRDNPFAPVGNDSGVITKTVQSTNATSSKTK